MSNNNSRKFKGSTVLKISYQISVITLSCTTNKWGLNDPPSWFLMKYLVTGTYIFSKLYHLDSWWLESEFEWNG
jgi:hypothetical protein|uniref:Uncharacterized protein n=1 Tax=Populus trichocarpa TaxID=3694 RepID=A0A2K2CDH8_POPTR